MSDDRIVPELWGLRHAPELAERGEDGDVWLLTYDGEDVEHGDCYGRGFAHGVLRNLRGEGSE